MPSIIETHAHIYDEQFDTDRNEMLQRAFGVGVEQIWIPTAIMKLYPECSHWSHNTLSNAFP
jgi:Tat protein secretion system quality control protein TatD with DNase activity